MTLARKTLALLIVVVSDIPILKEAKAEYAKAQWQHHIDLSRANTSPLRERGYSVA
jgi:hypothetical protein